MLRHLLPHATRVVLTAPPTPRAAAPEALMAAALAIDPGAHVGDRARSRRRDGRRLAAGPDITVAGSIFLLGAVLPVARTRGASSDRAGG